MTKSRIPQKAKCPCCGMRTLETKGKYEICPVCNWEDDPVQAKNLTLAGGANALSLKEARAEWQRKQESK